MKFDIKKQINKRKKKGIHVSIDLMKVWRWFKKRKKKDKEEKVTKKINVKKISEQLLKEVQDNIGKVKKIKSLNTKSVRTILDVIESVVNAVEEHGTNVVKLSGKDKKKLAVTILNKYINIPVPYVPRVIMEKVEQLIIGLLIDIVVGFLNKKFGKKWLKDEPK